MVYHNPRRRDTFGKRKADIKRVVINYSDQKEPAVLSLRDIPSAHAQDFRDRKIDRVDIELG